MIEKWPRFGAILPSCWRMFLQLVPGGPLGVPLQALPDGVGVLRRGRTGSSEAEETKVESSKTRCAGDATAVQIHKIFINGLWLSYVDRGKGAPIVLVPGSMADLRIWTNQIEPLSRHNRVLAYSRRYNWPNSAPGTGADGSMQRQVEDLADLMRGLGLAPAHIVGHSYGGSIALFLALGHPEVVRTLVLAEPAVWTALENVPGMEASVKTRQDFVAAVSQASASGDAERFVKTIVDFVAPGENVPSEIHNMFVSNVPAVKVENSARFTCEDARHINVPTLVLAGDRSPLPFRHMAEIVARCVPGGELVKIPEAGHTMYLMNPQAFSDAVLAFVGRH